MMKLQLCPETGLTSSSRARMINLGRSSILGPPSSLLFERQQAILPSGAPKQRSNVAGQSQSPQPVSGLRHRPPRPRQSPIPWSSSFLVPVHSQLPKGNKLSASQWNGAIVVNASGTPGSTANPAAPAPSGPPSQAFASPWPSSSALPSSAPGPSTSPSSTPPSSASPSSASLASAPLLYTPPSSSLLSVTPFAMIPVSQSPSPTAFLSPPPSLLDKDRLGKLDFGRDEIDSERKLTAFLAEVDMKLAAGSGKTGCLGTPPIGQEAATVPSPSIVISATSTSSTPISTSRVLRISPTASKGGSPRKGEVEMPLPMSMEQAAEVFKRLGIYSQIEKWRDRLRQWFSDVLLNPLVRKIDTSHLQVMAAAAKLEVTVFVTQVGANKQDGSLQDGCSTSVPSEGSQQEWLTTLAPDEDVFLHQLRATLLHALDGPIRPQNALISLRPQERVYNSHIQVCLDAVTEHQRLKALMKGEWVKGLLPQTNVRVDCTVQRIRDLAEGTCVKAYEFCTIGDVYEKASKRWTPELPSDVHLLLYLFCSLLEHPQWMMHVDPTSYPSAQSGSNSLFIAGLPHRERYPEKYIAIISGAPPVLHAGGTILAVGKSSPPVFALYWDKKLQFSFQGRSALWDAILLLCYRVKVAHGGVVRGISLGSPAFNLLPVLEPPN